MMELVGVCLASLPICQNFALKPKRLQESPFHHVALVYLLLLLDRKPRRVLEMGCGNGMILFRGAQLPGIETYLGADLSTEATQYIDRVLKGEAIGPLPHVTCRSPVGAHESDKFMQDQLDTIVCNGVSMYFPSLVRLAFSPCLCSSYVNLRIGGNSHGPCPCVAQDYTQTVIQNALDAIQPGGAFFLGRTC